MAGILAQLLEQSEPAVAETEPNETVEAVESAIAENPESERIIRAVVDAIADEMGNK